MTAAELLALWRKTRQPRVADVLALAFPIEVTLAAATLVETTARVSQLEIDPRNAPPLVALVAAPPFRTKPSRDLWKAVAAQLVALGDVRQIDPLVELAARYHGIITTSLGMEIKRELEGAVVMLRKIRPQPLDPDEEAAIRALERQHDAELQARAAGVRSAAGARRTDEEMLAAIHAAPDDDGPRLVYADWLVERGDPRGEFITMQIRRDPSTRGRERRFFLDHGKEWSRPLAAATSHVTFERGFPARVARAPSDNRFARLVGDPVWSTVIAADMSRLWNGTALRWLADPTTRTLRELQQPSAEVLLETPRDFEVVHLSIGRPSDPIVERLRRMPLRALGIQPGFDASIDWLVEPFADRALERFVVFGTYQVRNAIAAVERSRIARLELRVDGTVAVLERDANGKLGVLVVGPGRWAPSVDDRLVPSILAALPDDALGEIRVEVPYEREIPSTSHQLKLLREQIDPQVKRFPRVKAWSASA